MRTLKKTLCLVLAVVMVLGLCAFGVSAEFNDADKIQYSEAADVLNAIGVIKGTGAGDFDPAKELTRAEGATIIARLLGQNSENGTAPFDDCESVNSWAGFAIDYCASQGIIAGDGNGHFLPTQPLTGSAFAKMLLTALGYDAEIEGLTGAGWEVGVAKLIRSISLDDGIDDFDQTATLNRETAAQLAFTALTETMVYYDARRDSSDGSINTHIQTDYVENTASTYEYNGAIATAQQLGLTTGAPSERNNPIDTMQLCEKYFPKLSVVNNGTDAAGREANIWFYKGEEVNKTSKEADDKTVVEKTGKTYADIVTDYNGKLKPTTATAAAEIYINGMYVGTADVDTTEAKVGDLIEIFTNPNDVNEVSRIVVTKYSAAKLSGAPTTKTSGGVEQVTVPGVLSNVDVERVNGYEGLAKDDVVYYYADKNNTNPTNDDIWHIFKAESFEGKVTVFTAKDGTTPAKYTIDGTKYMVNENVGYGSNLNSIAANAVSEYNTTYQFWTDGNGFLIRDKKVEDGDRDYVLVYDLKWVSGTSLSNSDVAEARLVFMDGSTKVVSIDTIDGFTPINADNDVATLTAMGGPTNGIDNYYYSARTTAAAAASATTGTTSITGASYFAPGYYYLLTDGSGETASDSSTKKFLAVSSNVTENSGTDLSSARSQYVAANGGGATNVTTVNAATAYTLYTYSINSDGSYVLEDANNLNAVAAGNIANGNATVQAKTSKIGNINNTVAVNDSTVFVVIKDPTKSSPSFNVYTGKDNCPRLSNNTQFAYASEKGVATNVVVVTHGGSAVTGNYIYLLSNSYKSTTKIKGNDNVTTTYYIWDAYVDGEVQEVLLTGTAETNAVNSGIGLYTDPVKDDNGGYSGLDNTQGNGSGWGTTQADRNITLAYGWNMSGTTLQTGKTWGGNTYAYNFNCPADAVYIVKDGDDFTVGTAADMDSDDNDRVYIALDANHSTTSDNGNTVQVVYVIKQDSNETGFSLVDTKGTVYTSSKATGINGDAAQTYTLYTNATAVTPTTVTVTFNAACKVEYLVGTTTVQTTAINGGTQNIEVVGDNAMFTMNVAGTDSSWALKVTAEDGTVAYYGILHEAT